VGEPTHRLAQIGPDGCRQQQREARHDEQVCEVEDRQRADGGEVGHLTAEHAVEEVPEASGGRQSRPYDEQPVHRAPGEDDQHRNGLARAHDAERDARVLDVSKDERTGGLTRFAEAERGANTRLGCLIGSEPGRDESGEPAAATPIEAM